MLDWITENWRFLFLANFMLGASFSVLLKLNLLTAKLDEVQEELRDSRDGEWQESHERIDELSGEFDKVAEQRGSGDE